MLWRECPFWFQNSAHAGVDKQPRQSPVYQTEVPGPATKLWSLLTLMSCFCLSLAVNRACGIDPSGQTRWICKNRYLILNFFNIPHNREGYKSISGQICFLKSRFKDPKNYSEQENNKSLTSVRAGTETQPSDLFLDQCLTSNFLLILKWIILEEAKSKKKQTKTPQRKKPSKTKHTQTKNSNQINSTKTPPNKSTQKNLVILKLVQQQHVLKTKLLLASLVYNSTGRVEFFLNTF